MKDRIAVIAKAKNIVRRGVMSNQFTFQGIEDNISDLLELLGEPVLEPLAAKHIKPKEVTREYKGHNVRLVYNSKLGGDVWLDGSFFGHFGVRDYEKAKSIYRCKKLDFGNISALVKFVVEGEVV
jgi:hypothetical protein